MFEQKEVLRRREAWIVGCTPDVGKIQRSREQINARRGLKQERWKQEALGRGPELNDKQPFEDFHGCENVQAACG
jgi:hypothetical protein